MLILMEMEFWITFRLEFVMNFIFMQKSFCFSFKFHKLIAKYFFVLIFCSLKKIIKGIMLFSSQLYMVKF